IMCMLMVFIMHMFVFVLQLFMNVMMLMLFREMEPNPKRHQQAGNDQGDGERFAQCQSQYGAEKRGDGKIRPGTGGAEMAKRDDKERQAHPIRQQSKHHRTENECG